MEAYSRASGLQSAKAIIELTQGQQPAGQQSPANGVPSWCICKMCCPVATTDENNAVGRYYVLYCNHVFKALYWTGMLCRWQLLVAWTC